MDPRINLTLPLSDVNLILRGLGELPLKDTVEVWAKIKAQAEPQANPPTPAQKQEQEEEQARERSRALAMKPRSIEELKAT